MKNILKVLPAIAILLLPAIIFSGCTTKEAIESRELSTTVKMSETVFLDPVEPEQMVIYVRVRNTSDKQDIDPVVMQNGIEKKLKRRGYRVTRSPSEAYYRLQANVLFADHERKGLTEEGMLLGGFGGGALGGLVSGDHRSKTAATVVGAVGGAVIGGIAGSMVHIDKYMLVVDVQISERVEGGVNRTHSGGASKGKVQVDQSAVTKSDYLNYRTRVVGTAKKTNLKWKEAQPILLDQFTSSLAGIF